MEKQELDKKINRYLDERLIYYVGFSELNDAVINDVLDGENYDSIVDFMKLILDFENEHKNKLPVSVFKNFAKFVNTQSIRFNNEYKNKEVYTIINEIIGNANEAVFDDYTFFANEATKFFDNKERVLREDYVLILEIERMMHSFLEDILYAPEDEFKKRYLQLFSRFSANNPFYNLFMINYIVNDFPLLFENKKFNKRISSILKAYSNDTKNINIITQALYEVSLKDKIGCMVSYKLLRRKNKAVIQNIENEIEFDTKRL